jgi:hypothetical protein
MTWAEVLRIGWVLVALAGVAYASYNLYLRRRAQQVIRNSGQNGVLKVRAKFSVRDAALVLAAVLSGLVAGVSAVLSGCTICDFPVRPPFQLIALFSLCAEHVFLAWLAISMVRGWRATDAALDKYNSRLLLPPGTKD